MLHAAAHNADYAAIPGCYYLTGAVAHAGYAGSRRLGAGEHGPVHHVCQPGEHGIVQRLRLAACRQRCGNRLLFCRRQRCQRGNCVDQVHAHDYCRQDLFRLLFMTVFVFYLSAFFIIVKAHFLISSCFFFSASGFPLALVLPAASGSSLWSAISRSMTLFTASGVM